LTPVDTSAGKALRKGFEGLVLFAYDDEHPWEPAQPGTTIEGTLTIGRGHTGPDVYPGLAITEPEADALFDADWNKAVDGVLQLLDPSIAVNGNQLGAMASLAFNIGARAFAHSYVLERFNKGDMYGASQGFSHFETSKGVRKSDLVKCRQLEAALFSAKAGMDAKPANLDKTHTTAELNAQELTKEADSATS
jgi:lysozyme